VRGDPGAPHRGRDGTLPRVHLGAQPPLEQRIARVGEHLLTGLGVLDQDQAEVGQGTLTTIFEFQSMLAELTGMDLANASLYDGASALAEAALLAASVTGKSKIVVAGPLHPNYLQVLETYCRGQGIEVLCDPSADGVINRGWVRDSLPGAAAVVAQSPNFFGLVEDVSGVPPLPIGGPGVPPLQAATGVGYGEGFAANSHRNAPSGWMPAVKYLVEELGADVNARDHEGNTALHHAAARGDNEMILYLVSKGADVKAVNRAGETTVDMANGPVQRIQPFPETIALLEKLGAKNNHRCKSC